MSHDPAQRNAARPTHAVQSSSADAAGNEMADGLTAEQMREIAERYGSIFEAAGEAMVVTDLDGVIVEANSAACRLFGHSHEELVGLPASALLHPADLIEGSVEAAPVRGSLLRQGVGQRKDGSLFHAEARVTGFSLKAEPHIALVVRDISERIQAEEHLREKEEQYRSIFEATTDGLGVLDMEGNIVEVNPAYCEMYGYSRDEVIGLHAFALMHPDYHHLLADGMRSIEMGNPVRVRSAGLRRDGTSFPVDGRGTTFLFNGKPHILGVSRDITEQVQAEKELQEREAEYGAVFQATTDGLVVNDLETGVIVEANPAFCRMHGYTHVEMVGMHPSKHIHPDYHHLFAEYVRTAKDGHTFQTQAVDVRKDGTLFPVEVHGSAFTYKGTPHVLGVVRDITARVQAEEQLREREAEYRGIFEATNDGLIIGDLEGHIVEANPAYCRMFGYARDELIGLDARQLTAPGYRHVVDEALRAEAVDGAYQTTALGLRKDGTTFHVDARGTSFMYRGRPHNLSVVQDVTERVRAYELLEQRVEERTRELSTLLDVSHNVSSTLELRPLLDLILDQIAEVIQYAGASISLIEGEASEIVAFRGRGSADVAIGLRIPVEQMDPGPESWGSAPLVIDDVRADTPEAVAYRRNESQLLDSSFSYVRSWMAVPLIVNEQLVGVLTLNGSEPGLYTTHHAELVRGIASQAAVAIENARLYQKAQEVAVLEERQRLSRELHDSVSQALYGIVLGARTARDMADQDPTKIIAPLDYVLSLAQTGLDEMRALIFELRPEALEQEGLAAALQKQADAITARHSMQVTTVLCDEPEAPLGTKVELYRIAQEALQNTVKHAEATEVRLSLERPCEEIVLTIQDNGKGFDTTGSFPGHLGLHSMRERAERFGGTVQIESTVGGGTTISVTIPLRST